MKKIDFTKFSSIKIGSIREVKIIKDYEKLNEYFIIGACNNILLSNEDKRLAILDKRFDFINLQKDYLHVGGATKSSQLLKFAKQNNLANFELCQKLPGTIGGMIKMNAGLKKHEIFNNLIEIRTHNGWINKKDIEYSYRHTNIDDIIYEAKFELKKGFNKSLLTYFKNLRDNQPNYPSCGSCFKNPKNDFAGRLIEAVGLKGKSINDISFSNKHANFLINKGKGTYKDAIELINEAKKRVFEEFNIKLELEIVII